MKIERTQTEVIFRLPNTMNIDDLQDLSDFFEYKELAQKSSASQKDVDALVATIKKGRREETKSKLGFKI